MPTPGALSASHAPARKRRRSHSPTSTPATTQDSTSATSEQCGTRAPHAKRVKRTSAPGPLSQPPSRKRRRSRSPVAGPSTGIDEDVSAPSLQAARSRKKRRESLETPLVQVMPTPSSGSTLPAPSGTALSDEDSDVELITPRKRGRPKGGKRRIEHTTVKVQEVDPVTLEANKSLSVHPSLHQPSNHPLSSATGHPSASSAQPRTPYSAATLFVVGGKTYAPSPLSKKDELAVQRRERAQAREIERVKVEKQKAEDRERRVVAASTAITRPEEEGGFGFSSVGDYLTGLFDTCDQQLSATVTRTVKSRGQEIVNAMVVRAPEETGEVVLGLVGDIFANEVKALATVFSKDWSTTVNDSLRAFNMDKMSASVWEAAPTLIKVLIQAVGGEDRSKQQHDVTKVLTTVGAMLAVLHSRKASTFQTVIGVYCVASGVPKRVHEVLSQAGLALSYNGSLKHVKALSIASTRLYLRVLQNQMCSILWDNLNIPFHVNEQRFGSKDHFDNGTTLTLLAVFDPDVPDGTTAHGTLPLSMKPPRLSRRPIVDYPREAVVPKKASLAQLGRTSLWTLMDLAIANVEGLDRLHDQLSDYPTVEQIRVHKTKQYAQPARHIDESSIDGTIEVFLAQFKHLGITAEFIKKHGLFFGDGDLLSMGLADKIEAARRNSPQDVDTLEALQMFVQRFGLFHCKMAACRMIINEHWGKPNSPWPEGLYWENSVLDRKVMAAGWKNKKPAPFGPSKELLNLSLAAHVIDAVRIHCGEDDIKVWAASATIDDLRQVCEVILKELFSTIAVDKLRAMPEEDRDVRLENTILYNRDVLLYVIFVHAIKRGDIGCVINVLQVWAIQFRGTGSMPNYADIIFLTLRRLDTYPHKLRQLFKHNWLVNLTGKPFCFKENDLHQEHQNMWDKAIYIAKGSNKSWDWLSMMSVIVWVLRDIIRTVQSTYGVTNLGTKHKTPDSSAEKAELAKKLGELRIQEYVMDREYRQFITPVRDLVHEGTEYLNTAKAYTQFRQDTRQAVNHGIVVTSLSSSTSPCAHTPSSWSSSVKGDENNSTAARATTPSTWSLSHHDDDRDADLDISVCEGSDDGQAQKDDMELLSDADDYDLGEDDEEVHHFAQQLIGRAEEVLDFFQMSQDEGIEDLHGELLARWASGAGEEPGGDDDAIDEDMDEISTFFT